MSDNNLPAVPPSVALAQAETDRKWNLLERQARMLAKTKIVPKDCQDAPMNIMAGFLVLDAFGIQPNAVSINQLHWIEGRPEPSYQMLTGLLYTRGYTLDWVECSETRAEGKLRRPDGTWTGTISWSIDQARRAGLLDRWVEQRVQDGKWADSNRPKWKTTRFVLTDNEDSWPDWVRKEVKEGRVKRQENWWKYPDDMLAAKVVRRLVKRYAGHISLGLENEAPTADRTVDAETGELHVWDHDAPPTPPEAAAPDEDQEITDAEIVDDDEEDRPGPGYEPAFDLEEDGK